MKKITKKPHDSSDFNILMDLDTDNAKKESLFSIKSHFILIIILPINNMKTHLLFTILIVMSVFVIADVNAEDDSNIKPEDQPNFYPKISTDVIDGKTVQIMEFGCKLAK